MTGEEGRPGLPPERERPRRDPPRETPGLDFFSELKRRKVYRAGAAYLAVAFALIEGASLVFPTFGLGPGAFNAVVLAGVIGFPLTVALAWTFEITDGAVRRTTSAGTGPEVAAPDRWARPKAAAVGAGFVGMVWLAMTLWQPLSQVGDNPVPVDAPVLAVLPLEDLSPGGDQAYFADGLHEELLHQLAGLRGIRLISRTSVSHFRGSSATLAAIADSLGARYVLEGSVRRSADSVQVTVQLIDASYDRHLWSESYGVTLSLAELFGVQRDVAMRVARSLGGTLAAGTGQSLGSPPTSSLEAYHAYLRGLHHYSRFDMAGLEAAAGELVRAVERDPGFGRAHGKLAFVYGVMNNFGSRTQGELFPLIRSHAELAVRHAPDDPVSHMAMATSHWAVEQEWEAARLDLERALDLDPDFADARWALAEWYGVIAGNTDRGLETIREARRLDPLAVQPRAVRAWILTNGRRYAEAAAEYGSLAEWVPGAEREYTLNMASNLALAGRHEEALERIREVLPSMPTPRPVRLAVHLARAGDTATAREIVGQAVALKRSGGSVAASSVAAAYAAVGEIEEALDWLERSFEQEGGVYYLRSPDWAPLWGLPRFRAIWDRAGLPGDYPRPAPSTS